MDTLPVEMLMVIASFLPGLSINRFCILSTRHNIAARPIRDKLWIIHKVRSRLMNNSIELIMRHIYYFTLINKDRFDPVYEYQRGEIGIVSYKAYKKIRENLLDRFSNINFTSIHCRCCFAKVNLNYYIFDSVDRDDDNFLDILCHGCYHKGVIGYYQAYGKLPGAYDTYRDFLDIIFETVYDPVPAIPLAITKYFDRLEGGYINFQRD